MSKISFWASVTLEAAVSPSEDPTKVARALENLLGQQAGGASSGSSSASLVTDDPAALLHIRDQLRDRHIRSAARRRLLLNREKKSAFLMLNRQAATAGVLVICDNPQESPLGPIYLTIESKDLDAAIDWLTSYPDG